MLYIHIPFCKTRCIYCDFYSSIDIKYKDLYIDAICREIMLKKDYLGNAPLSSIYFGGGTPSLLDIGSFEKIFESIFKYFELSPNCEITIECNPDDINPFYVKKLNKIPFNRVSLGIQSFVDSELKLINRRHSAQEAIEAVRIFQDNNFDNISIDLIYSLPNQTIASWQKTIDTALDLDIQHISAYSLIYEEGTKLYIMSKRNQIKPIADDTSLELFKMLRKNLLYNDFFHYEISNFAKTGFQSRHNSGYWSDKKYIGVGASAHSYNGVSRQWNIANLHQYCQNIFDGGSYYNIEYLSEENMFNEMIMLSLRTSKGLPLGVLKNKFGEERMASVLKIAQKYIDSGLLTKVGDSLVLTEKGIFVSDGIIVDFIF